MDPLEYRDARWYALLREAADLGVPEEEAPALGKPVLVFREVTERPEALAAGGALLVGSDPEQFRHFAEELWQEGQRYAAMAQPRFPYGDGRAATRIAGLLRTECP